MLILPIAMLFTDRAVSADPAAPQATQVDVQKYDLAANQDTPELCFTLSASVARRPATPLESFVTVDPAITLSATPRNDRLCLTGFAFGNSYTISLKAGLPGVAGTLGRDAQFRIDIPNRPPELAFAAPENTVLPRIGNGGLPIRSVNIPKIDVRIFRVADADMLLERTRAPLTAEAAAAFAPARGERVWQGAIEPKGAANQDSVTTLATDQAIGTLKPGLYVATAWPAGWPATGQALPTQYFTVSDLGLAAYRGPGSLLVAARSLATAAAAPGIDIALVARNNRELGRARTDGNGFARFDAGALQSLDGDQPAAIHAYGPAGEFAAMSLEAFDAQDRGDVALVHMDRAIYRPGESVNVLALKRSDQGIALSKQPMVFTVIRPNGAVFSAQTLNDQGDGAYNFTVTIPDTGSAGSWRVEARVQKDGKLIGSAGFTVDDTAQSSLNVSLNADVAVIDPTQAANIAVQTQTMDGQAAGIPGELRVAITAAEMPFPAFPGFSFGLADEAIAPLVLDPVRFTTDATGKINLPLKIAVPAKATRPLEASVTAHMLDSGGRSIEHAITIQVANQNLLLGVKAAADAIFPAGQNAHFEVIAVSPDGARQEKPGTGWEILRQDWKPSWSMEDGRFVYRPAVQDTHITGGSLDIPANAPAMLDAAGLAPGRYRIEVFDPNGEAISSTRFMVGWAVRNGSDAADAVVIKPAKANYAPGEGLDIFVKPPFESDIVLAPADPEIRDPVVQHVPAAGATMHLNLPRDTGIATQLFATAVAAPDAAAPGLTRRAFGQLLVAADPAPRSLDVKADLPATALPQRTLSIPVTVTGAGDDPVYVRVAVTDERLDEDGTQPDSPIDPLIAKQASTVAVIDNYGHVITPTGLSSGGMTDPAAPDAGAQHVGEQQKPVSTPLGLYSGIVTLDKGGKGIVSLALPDYAGQVKVRLVAWSGNRSGQAAADVSIHDPLNASLSLPEFLAPDDHADLTLALDNVDGPRGEYHVKVRADGAVTVQDETEAVVNLAEHEQRTAPVAIQAHGQGDGAITIGITGPDGIAFERHLVLKVRSTAPAIVRHAMLTVKPGTTLALDPAVTAGIRPESLAISAVASAGNDLDPAGIAQDLIASDTGSAEGIVDTATLYVAPPALPSALGLAPGGRVEQAVQSLAALQGGDGGFNPTGKGPSDPWLTAAVVEFLGRAKASGAIVSDVLLSQALDYLALHAEPASEVAGSPPSQRAVAIAAYADKILAANGRLNLFQLRYFSDRFQAQMRSPVSIGLVAASFASLGDRGAAAAAFARAGTLQGEVLPADLFGSDLRDQAMLNALMVESGAVAQASIGSIVAKTAAIAANHRQFNGQEASWLLRAAAAGSPVEAKIRIKLGDKTVEQSAIPIAAAAGQALPMIKNLGDTPIHVALTATGAPAPGEAKEAGGYEVQRWFFDTSGKPVDPAAMKQGDLMVVVLTGRFTGQGETRPLIRDPLPAGWAVEAAEITDPANRYPWLKDLTGASDSAVADGRYSATPHLAGERREFKLAYVVRAAVRGQFSLPGTVIEDRIQPALSARGAAGRTKIDPAS